MTKVLCVLYPNPETGYPPRYAPDRIPKIAGFVNGMAVFATEATPSA